MNRNSAAFKFAVFFSAFYLVSILSVGAQQVFKPLEPLQPIGKIRFDAPVESLEFKIRGELVNGVPGFSTLVFRTLSVYQDSIVEENLRFVSMNDELDTITQVDGDILSFIVPSSILIPDAHYFWGAQSTDFSTYYDTDVVETIVDTQAPIVESVLPQTPVESAVYNLSSPFVILTRDLGLAGLNLDNTIGSIIVTSNRGIVPAKALSISSSTMADNITQQIVLAIDKDNSDGIVQTGPMSISITPMDDTHLIGDPSSLGNQGDTMMEEFTIDVDPPVIHTDTVNVSVNQQYNSVNDFTNITLNLSDVGSGIDTTASTVTASFNGAAIAIDENTTANQLALTLSQTVEFPSSGTLVIEMIVQDLAGNVSAAQTLSYTIDRDPPVIQTDTVNVIESLQYNSVEDFANITLTISDVGSGIDTTASTVTASFNGAAVAIDENTTDNQLALTLSQTVEFPSSGTLVIEMIVHDLAGNVSAAQTLSYTIDRDPPMIGDADVTEDLQYNSVEDFVNITLPIFDEFSGIDINGSVVNASFNGAEIGIDENTTAYQLSLSLSQTVEFPASGTLVIEMTVQDLAGNVSAAQTLTYAIDRIAPTASISIPVELTEEFEGKEFTYLNLTEFSVMVEDGGDNPSGVDVNSISVDVVPVDPAHQDDYEFIFHTGFVNASPFPVPIEITTDEIIQLVIQVNLSDNAGNQADEVTLQFNAQSVAQIDPLKATDFNSLENLTDRWMISAGFGGQEQGEAALEIGSPEEKSVIFTMDSDEVSFMIANGENSLQAEGPVLYRARIASNPNCQVSVGAIRGIFESFQDVDGSLFYNSPAGANAFDGVRSLIFDPHASSLQSPFIQAYGLTGAEAVQARLDWIQMYQIESSKPYLGNLFGQADVGDFILPENTAYILNPSPDVEYPFATDLTENWTIIAGGFNNAETASVERVSFDPGYFETSADNQGIEFTASDGQVILLMTQQPIQAKRVLMAMTYRTDSPQNNIFFGAVDMTSGHVGVNYIIDPTPILGNEMRMLVLFEADAENLISPLIQVAGANEGIAAKVAVDRIEIYALQDDEIFTGSIFNQE